MTVAALRLKRMEVTVTRGSRPWLFTSAALRLKTMRDSVLIHDVKSTHDVGSIHDVASIQDMA
jgi:ribosomal protein L30/L7E